MAKPSQKITTVVLQLVTVLQTLVKERRQDEVHLHAVEEDARQLGRRCALLAREIEIQRRRDKRLIRQLSRQRDRAENERQLATERLYVERVEARRWQERYSLVDEERREALDQLEALVKLADVSDPLPVITDTQICPCCEGTHMVGHPKDIYRCLHCGQTFRLAMRQTK